VAARLEALEKRRDANTLTDAELQQLRKDFFTLKKEEGKPAQATEKSYLDWLFS
jgi:hypothetical protein